MKKVDKFKYLEVIIRTEGGIERNGLIESLKKKSYGRRRQNCGKRAKEVKRSKRETVVYDSETRSLRGQERRKIEVFDMMRFRSIVA